MLIKILKILGDLKERINFLKENKRLFRIRILYFGF